MTLVDQRHVRCTNGKVRQLPGGLVDFRACGDTFFIRYRSRFGIVASRNLEYFERRRSDDGSTLWQVCIVPGTKCEVDEDRHTLLLPDGQFESPQIIRQALQFNDLFAVFALDRPGHEKGTLAVVDDRGVQQWITKPWFSTISYAAEDNVVSGLANVATVQFAITSGEILDKRQAQ